ncbi:ATP-dependent DNA ligase [Microbacterium sp. LMI1-1-1.1]|uniref:DUF7882 family protein n=1 Tax=unclassified Microbacterium TaxID=2609290 RepID=UPI0034679E1E
MGKFIVETLVRVEFEDRLLSHLERVITTKLRRNESFTFSWKDDISIGGGRTTIWLHPNSNILYKFHGSRTPHINRAWVQALTLTAAGPQGLHVVPEPADTWPEAETREPMTFQMAPDAEQHLPSHGPVIVASEKPADG